MGLFDSIAGALFGDGGEADIRRTGRAARGDLEEGFEEFSDIRSEFLDRSRADLQPDVDTGRSALAQLATAFGLTSPEAQAEFFEEFENDPGFSALQDAGVRAITTAGASTGLRKSGGQLKELFQFGQQLQNQFFNDRFDRLERLSGTGSNAAAAQSGQTERAGTETAGARFGLGQLVSNNRINTTNAAVQAANVPINNLIGLATGAGKIAAAV